MLRALFGIAAIAIVVGLVFRESLATGHIVLTEGVIAVLILASATGAGLWLLPVLGLRNAPVRWQIMLGAGLGIGTLMLLMLGAGLLGLLHRWLWIAAIALMFVAGAVRVALLARAVERTASPMPAIQWLWLLAMPALAVTLLVAAVPPGFLWQEEARGYDVLEYHLGAPKEYLAAEQITCLPHNVYANFPSNVEMLYLLAMIVPDDPSSAALVAKMLNALLAVLTVAAVWLAGREFSPAAGVVAGVVAATMPWLTYLSGVCFVENGMLFFGALSVACLCRAASESTDASIGGRSWPLAAGLLAGLSCGCKYTAVPMFALPIVVAFAIVPAATRKGRVVGPALVVLGALITFAPWLAKNVAMTGNPVFPLAHRVFGAHADIWDDGLDAKWRAGHQPAPGEDAIRGRLGALGSRVLGEPRFSVIPAAVFVLAVIGLTAGRRRIDAALAVVLLVQLAVWMFATHLYARFAVPALVPLAVLCGRTMPSIRAPVLRGAVLAVAIVVVGANLYPSWRLYYDHLYLGETPEAPIPHGQITELCDSWVNDSVPSDGYVLLVGDVRAYYVQCRVDYSVVFNRNPFAEAISAVGGDAERVMTWLRDRGYTHVAVQWTEVDRLGRTYGFWPEIDRALFERLTAAGLRIVDVRRSEPGGPPWATVYEVPAE